MNTTETPKANGTPRPAISLVRCQNASAARDQARTHLETLADTLRAKDDRHREALRSAYTAGMQLSQSRAWEKVFVPALLLGFALGAGTTMAALGMLWLGLNP